MLGASFALFLVGAAALSLERGTLRTALLAVALTALAGIAVAQTVRRLRKNRD
ncbi:hypothetical protein [Alistipes sp.]|uniref:hypothetical protein n=1 Tax=Alistipes sp. TaxID=1872444 RepID=UPI003AF0A03F